MVNAHDIAATLASLSRLYSTAIASGKLPGLLDDAVRVTRGALPQASSVTLTVLDEAGARTVAATDDLGRAIDEQQYRLGEGPCLHASVTGEMVRVAFVAERPQQWAPLARFAEAKGVRVVLSVALPSARGSLNLYRSEPHLFSEEAEDLATVFASYAAIIELCADTHWRGLRQAEQLQRALESRPLIEQAKGILMGQRRCSPEEAFAVLVAASQRENMKLRQIAQRVVEGVQR